MSRRISDVDEESGQIYSNGELLFPERDNRIDAYRAERRRNRRQAGSHQKARKRQRQAPEIRRIHLEQQRRDKSAESESSSDSDPEANGDYQQHIRDDQTNHSKLLRTERHPDTDFF